MATGRNSQGSTNFGVPGIRSGYGGKSTPNLTIPPVGIEDADSALFKLFDKELEFQVSTSNKNREEVRRVPVIFAAAEKWAFAKKNRAIRDINGSLILPIITIVRTSLQQDSGDDITGRGINQQTGEMVIQRRLDGSDRGYQNLINRLFLQNQLNLAVDSGTQLDGQVSTDRAVGDLALDPVVMDGGLLLPDRRKNVYETIVVPSPQFFTATYEVTFWTQYALQMSQLIESLMSSFLPQGNAWKLETPKGYWFIATVEGNTYASENNVDDMSQDERIIKYRFTVKVPGYIMATQVPGAPVPLKRYVSSPVITFDVGLGETESVEGGVEDTMLLGADDPTLPLQDVSNMNSRRDLRNVNGTRLLTDPDADPAHRSLRRGHDRPRYKRIVGIDGNGRKISKLVRVVSTNSYTGETVFAADRSLGGLKIVVSDD